MRQPQPSASLGTTRTGYAQRKLGSSWNQLIAGVAYSDENPAKYRLRAMDLLQLFGPTLTADMLIELSESKNELVRARAVRLMAAHKDPSAVDERIIELVSDADPRVQRAGMRSPVATRTSRPTLDSLLPLLASDDRYLVWSARRLLERIPTELWKESCSRATISVWLSR